MLSCFSCVWLFASLWTVAPQALLAMIFSRQEYWNGLPFLPAGDLPGPALEAASLRSSALPGRFFNTNATREDHYLCGYYYWCSLLFPVDSNYCAVLFNFSLKDSRYCFLWASLLVMNSLSFYFSENILISRKYFMKDHFAGYRIADYLFLSEMNVILLPSGLHVFSC